MGRPTGNRDELIARILGQAASVFAEQGYRNSTTEDIAKKVNLKKSSLYHYFKNKENILFQALSINLTRSLEPLVALQNGTAPPRDRLHQAVVEQVKAMMGSPYVASLFLNERSSLHPRHLKHCLELRKRHEVALRSILEQGIADGSFAVADSNIAVKLIFGALNGLPWWWRPTGKYTIDETADIFADLLVERMLRAPDGPAGRSRPGRTAVSTQAHGPRLELLANAPARNLSKRKA